MPTEPTLDQIMASEIKRDIAQRYFGFRKLIEEDKIALSEKIRHYSFILEKRISFDLLRIYVLLRDEKLIKEFLELIELHEKLFYDTYLIESVNIANRVLACQRFRGWFPSTRFKNFIMDCYENLIFHTHSYGRKVQELENEQEFIVEEIKQFYRDNDLSVILHFIKSLSDPELSGDMRGGMEIGMAEGLDKKINIIPPVPIEQMMKMLPPFKPLAKIKAPLKKIIKKAYLIQPPEMLEMFSKKNSPCDRKDGDGLLI